ncbi:MAG: 1,4-alpha-glucan branching protein GlgB [Clostridia bacterium]|nr:1,4-alpha-glucan branching protein GlgB [Clostridia bacterium]
MKTDERIRKIERGEDTYVYEYLGCHPASKGGKNGAWFRVYAPNAKEVFVAGDFNDWDKTSHQLKRIKNSNIWEVFVEKAKTNQRYKFIVIDKHDRELVKTDPYAFFAESLSNDKDFACFVPDSNKYNWKDSKYFESIKNKNYLESPMNIYEVCLLSWKKHADGSYYTYRELTTSLIPYCKKMGYTHIELLPITEFQLDCSWGYEVTNYYAITSRFGKPKDLKYFVDKCHESGIGVILDWVPGHFDSAETNSAERKNILTDEDFGLTEWDGTPLYESPKWDRQLQLAWGTRIFDYENPYVVNFLISSALYFLREFHFDGIRVDAVVSILYLDFCRNPDEWIPNVNGNNINYAGVEFLKKLNNTIFGEFPNALMIAEEVSSWPMTTRPTTVGGLGFNFKWNVGFINDIWEYTSMDPYFRKYHHNILTHTLDYCFDENFILPVDHDEVGNGRHSLINKMNGDMKTKMNLCRAFFLYMYMHPGKKLVFMGSEFGQRAEWSYSEPINWKLLNADGNKKLSKFVSSLNHLYLKTPEMWQRDFDSTGFEWLVENDNSNCVTCFKRYDKDGNYLISLTNFSPYRIPDYVLGIDEPGCYEEVFSSDEKAFGGTGELNDLMYSSIMNKNGKTNAIRVNIPANTSILIKKVIK